jgi:hypothetical protein
MNLKRAAVLVLLTALTFCPVGLAAQDEFDFYGLRFGMTRGEIETVMPLKEGSGIVTDPGHGISSIELSFEREGRLMEIRAVYTRPDEPLEDEGLRRALRERFITPVKSTFPGIQATLDEFSNRAGITLVFLNKGLREKNIHYHRDRYLKLME